MAAPSYGGPSPIIRDPAFNRSFTVHVETSQHREAKTTENGCNHKYMDGGPGLPLPASQIPNIVL